LLFGAFVTHCVDSLLSCTNAAVSARKPCKSSVHSQVDSGTSEIADDCVLDLPKPINVK